MPSHEIFELRGPVLEHAACAVPLASRDHSWPKINYVGTEPFPQSLIILGGPSKALNMMVIRPLFGSCKWLIVSLPEPLRSMYQNVLSSINPKYFPPLGETLTSRVAS